MRGGLFELVIMMASLDGEGTLGSAQLDASLPGI